MKNNEQEKKFTAAVGFGSHSDRHGEGVDPALPGSSSVEGPTASLPAGLAENVTTAVENLTRRKLRSYASRSDMLTGAEEETQMDAEAIARTDTGRDSSDDDDAKSNISLASNISFVTTGSTDRKRKLDVDYDPTAGKRKHEGELDSTYEFKEPSGLLSSSRCKALTKVPSRVRKSEEELCKMTTIELRNSALEWINHIDMVRKNSSNLQGRLSGIIKDRLLGLNDMINCLVDKIEEKGDPIYHMMQSKELHAKIKCLEREEAKWKIEKGNYEREIDALNKRNEEIETKLWEDSRRKDNKDERLVRIDLEKASEDIDREWPALRPPLKGVCKVLKTTALTPTPPVAVPPKIVKTVTGESSITGKGKGKGREMEELSREIKRLVLRKKQLATGGSNKDTDTETEGEDRKPRRQLPKIIGNVQVAPPRSRPTDGKGKDEEGWTKVSRMKGRKETMEGRAVKKVKKKNLDSSKERQPSRTRRIPKSAAVTITAKEGISYADILRQAREKISLSNMGIDAPKIRKGINGGLIIEISGEGHVDKAASLAGKLREVLPDRDSIRVAQPTTMAEIKISGLDDSVSKHEVIEVLAHKANCNPANITTGAIRWMTNGLGVICARCPVAIANIVAGTGKIAIGWTIAKVEILPQRPLQCYRCWNFGHARYSCESNIDRSGCCYKCGSASHKLAECTAAKPLCVICKEAGRKFTHRIGSTLCGAMSSGINKSKNRPLPRISREELRSRNRAVPDKTLVTNQGMEGVLCTREEEGTLCTGGMEGNICNRKEMETMYNRKRDEIEKDNPDRSLTDMDTEENVVP